MKLKLSKSTIIPCLIIAALVVLNLGHADPVMTNNLTPPLPASPIPGFPGIPPAPHDVVQVDSLASAFMAMLHFIGLNGTQATLLAYGLHLGARLIRNYFLKNKTTSAGKLASLIGHMAGDPLPVSHAAANVDVVLEQLRTILAPPAAPEASPATGPTPQGAPPKAG